MIHAYVKRPDNVNLIAASENIAVVLALHKGLTCRQLA
jgi:hypothetical protein